MRCDRAGSNCSAIAGATSQRYLLAAADDGRRLRVQETATNATGTSAPASSAPIAIVQARNGTITVGRVRTSGTAAGVVLSCSGAARATCPLTVTLTVTERVKGGQVTAVTALKRTPPQAKVKLTLSESPTSGKTAITFTNVLTFKRQGSKHNH